MAKTTGEARKSATRRRLSEAEILAQIPAARARTRLARRTEPRAAAARYDVSGKVVVVELTNGASFAFPARLAPGLERATPGELAAVEVSPSGEGLRWDALDADLSVPGMLALLMGPRAAMRTLGRHGGRVRSDAKARAARTNGAKGGRPKKVKPAR